MVMHLYWRPIAPRKGNSLSVGLKLAFEKRSGYPVCGIVNSVTVGWLEGVRDASRDDETRDSAQALIDAIEQYGEVEIFTE